MNCAGDNPPAPVRTELDQSSLLLRLADCAASGWDSDGGAPQGAAIGSGRWRVPVGSAGTRYSTRSLSLQR